MANKKESGGKMRKTPTTPENAALTAADLMTTEVATVSPDARLSDAIQLMLARRVSGLPVVSGDGRLCGMLTEGDLLRRAEIDTDRSRRRWLTLLADPATLADEYAQTHGKKVADVMTSDVVVVQEDTPIDQIVATMESYHVKRLPVQREQRVVGIISRADLLQALSSRIGRAESGKVPDKTIRKMLSRALHDLAWKRHRPRFEVQNGVVDLFWLGDSFDWERKAARIATENVPGVREIREHLLRD